MPIALSDDQQAALKAIAPAQDPAEFNTLFGAAKPEMDKIVTEVMEANQAIETTLLECSDLYLLVHQHPTQLDAVNYGPERRARFRDAIRLASTANLWLTESKRSGAYRGRTIEQVLKNSRPWRARLKAYGEQAFAFEPSIADQLADVNSTGTLDEEKADLLMLTGLVEQHSAALQEVGMKPEFVTQGRALLDEANGHGLLGILGIRSQNEAIVTRDRIFTYVTMLARHARAAGINACFDEPESRTKFEAASFRNALRRIQPKRRGGSAEKDEGEVKPEGGEGAKPEDGAVPKPAGGDK